MHPYLIQLPGGWGLPAYGAMLGLGFLFGYLVALRHARREGYNKEILADLWVISIVGGVLGARLWDAIETGNPVWQIFNFWQKGGIRGLVFYGGFLGAVLGTLIYLRWRRQPALRSYDLITPSLALGLAFGRMGCFLSGCCWGNECDLPWAVRFPGRIVHETGQSFAIGSPAFMEHFAKGNLALDATWSNLVHPVQLYELLAALAIFGILQWFYSRRKRDGEVLWLFVILYAPARIFFEFLRPDIEGNSPKIFHGLSGAQLFSAAAFILAISFFIAGRLTPKKPAPESAP